MIRSSHRRAGWIGLILVDLRVLLLDLIVEALARFPDLLGPCGVWFFEKSSLSSLIRLIIWRSTSLGSPTIGTSAFNLPSDSRRRGIDLDILGLVGPGRRLAEMLAAPEAEADRQHHVGAAGERLLEGAANRQRMLLGDRALPGAARVDRDEVSSTNSRISAPACDQNRPSPPAISGRSRRHAASRPRDRYATGSPAERTSSVVKRRAPLRCRRSSSLVVEDVLRNLDQRDALRRRNRLAERRAHVELNRGPVGHPLGELGEAATTSEP